MKKIILLLILPLTALLAIDFTMTKEGLFAPTTQSSTQATEPEAKNPYLEAVNLPKCDANNPEVQFIRSNADWSKINYSSKRIFCVSPGDYRSLKSIQLSASGTAEKRRYIILNNGNDLHPGKLGKSQLANFSLSFSGASYWTVDRASWFDTSTVGKAYTFHSESTNNVLNRAYSNEVIGSVQFRENANNNTVQNSRFQNMTDGARRADEVAISFYGSTSSFSIKNIKIINNEIKNAGDGIQTVIYSRDGKQQIANGEGIIIDNNHIYINSEIYTDGSGNYDPNGTSAYAENAIDLKFGSANASNPMIITNNIMWGYRKTDRTDAYCDDPGHAVVAHYGIKYIKFNDNIIFDSQSGFVSGDSGDFSFALSKSEFKNNLIYDSGAIYGNSAYSLAMFSSSEIDVQNNTIIGARFTLAKFLSNSSGMNVTNNVKVNSPVDMVTSANSGGSYEAFAEGTGYTKDLLFTTDNFTNSPRQVTLTNALKAD